MQNMQLFFLFFLLHMFPSFSFSVLHLINQNAMKSKVQCPILANLFSPSIWSSWIINHKRRVNRIACSAFNFPYVSVTLVIFVATQSNWFPWPVSVSRSPDGGCSSLPEPSQQEYFSYCKYIVSPIESA